MTQVARTNFGGVVDSPGLELYGIRLGPAAKVSRNCYTWGCNITGVLHDAVTACNKPNQPASIQTDHDTSSAPVPKVRDRGQ